jgi:hypothetical protein
MSEQALGPNKLAQVVAILTCILEVLTSNPGRDTDYPDWNFSWLYIVPPGERRSSTSNYATISFFPILSIQLLTNCNRSIIRSSSLYFTLMIDKKFWEELISYIPFIQQFFYCCVCIRNRGNVFTAPLPSNCRRDTHIDTQTDGRD